MPVSGRKPKGQTLAPARSVHGWTEVDDVAFTDAPRLPRTRPSGEPWPEHIRRKWRAWSSMPHCCLWQPSDWSFCIDTLEIATRLYESDKATYATELRYRERVLGTTVDARRDLRIRYVAPRPVLTIVRTPDDFRDL